jgi:hypothetical protein
MLNLQAIYSQVFKAISLLGNPLFLASFPILSCLKKETPSLSHTFLESGSQRRNYLQWPGRRNPDEGFR